MADRMVKKITQIERHRNGIGGEGFYAVLFTGTKDGGDGSMFAAVFPTTGHVAVVSLDRIAEHGVTFGENSWRGDNFEPELRGAIEKWRKAQGYESD